MSFLFINGQIRALESQLLNVNRLDRMIGARTPDEAFRVLSELQYARYLDEAVHSKDFHRIIEKGLLETKNLIVKGTGGHPGLEFLWRSEDINNLKRAYKIKFLEKKTELGNFTAENGFSLLGEISPEEIENIVFFQKIPDSLPDIYRKALEKVEIVYERKKTFRSIEYLFDQAHYTSLSHIARKLHSSFLKHWLTLQIDAVNVRTLARALLIQEEKLPTEAFLSKGNITLERLKKVKNWEQYLVLLKETIFHEAKELITEKTTNEEKILIIERTCDRVVYRFLQESESGEIDSIQVPIVYFVRRLRDARMIKCIMFAKFHGLSPEKILIMLKQF
jgi:V/A-type H+-transporting ATPase subunit C